MGLTKLVLDKQAVGQNFAFGTTTASGEALVTLNKGTAAASTVVLDAKGSVSVGGDLTVAGTLTIVGSIDQQTVTNLQVKDKTISLNEGGTTAGASNSGVNVFGDSDTTLGGLVYTGTGSGWGIGSGVFSGGSFATVKELVTVSDSQTLTSKILTSPTLNTPTISGGTINNTAIGGSTPAAGAFTTLSTSGAAVFANVSQSGASTFATGTGAISLNGTATFATGKALQFVVPAGYTVYDGSGISVSDGGSGGNFVISASSGGGLITLNSPTTVMGVLTSTVTTGTAPFVVASTTVVTNLNSDKLDGADLETTLSTGSDVKVSSSKAVATYVTSQISSATDTLRGERHRRLQAAEFTRTDGAGNGTATGARIVLAGTSGSQTALRQYTEQVYLDGQLLSPGASADYVVGNSNDTTGVAAIYFNSGWTTSSSENIAIYGSVYTDLT